MAANTSPLGHGMPICALNAIAVGLPRKPHGDGKNILAPTLRKQTDSSPLYVCFWGREILSARAGGIRTLSPLCPFPPRPPGGSFFMSLCSLAPHTDPSRREGECIFKDSTEPRYTTSPYGLVPTLRITNRNLGRGGPSARYEGRTSKGDSKGADFGSV